MGERAPAKRARTIPGALRAPLLPGSGSPRLRLSFHGGFQRAPRRNSRAVDQGHVRLLCLLGLAAAGCYRSHSVAREGASPDAAGAARCQTRSTSLGAYARVVGPVHERTTGNGDPVPLVWSGDGRRLIVGGSPDRYYLRDGRGHAERPPVEEFPPIVVLDATRPCVPSVARIPASNPRTGGFAQAVWVSGDGATVTACSYLLTDPGDLLLGFSLQVFRESARGFDEAWEVILERDSDHRYACQNLVVTPAALFVQASDGLFAYGEREGRLVEVARASEAATPTLVTSMVASSDGRRIAATVPPPWTTTDRRVEPVPVHLLSFSEDSAFAPMGSFSPDTDGWPPRGWHVDLAMPSSGEAVIARSEPRTGPTRVAVLRAPPTRGHAVSPVPAHETGPMPGHPPPRSSPLGTLPWRQTSIWVSPDGARLAWIVGHNDARDETTLTIADLTDAGIEERWTGFPAGVEGPEGCSTPWSARSAAFSPDGRLAVAAWCASASCPISEGRPGPLGCVGPLQVFVYE